jgi:proteasome-associated ATPase
MGDSTHIFELVERILEETEDHPELQAKVFDLRDALLHSQQENQRLALKIKTLEEIVEKLKSPAHRIGVVLGQGEGELIRLSVGGQEYQAAVSPDIEKALKVGDLVALNEGFAIISKLTLPEQGPIAKLASKLENGQWLISSGTGTTETMVYIREDVENDSFKEGDEVYLDPSQKVIIGKLPKRESAKLVEDDFKPVDWSRVGGQEKAVKEVRKVIEYPIMHADIIEKMEYELPKGFLFYGPPGCGKTLVGKAILTEIVSKLEGDAKNKTQGRFIHVKGPEILNMWLGESERKVREIFQKAREYRADGQLPFIFIDEAESVLGTRQATRGNNISNTLVPMFCAEMDGVQSLRDAVVILATNRPDLIDPAILRPGRIDRKIKVSRPDLQGCEDILKIYLTEKLPLEKSSIEETIRPGLDMLFAKEYKQNVLTLSMKNGDMKKLYWHDFISGAILENVVKRAKESAIERAITGEELKIKPEDLTFAIEKEFDEGSIFPADHNMEDWLQLLDFDSQNIARIRRPKESDEATDRTLTRSMI